jgi:hypothetical protein
MLILLSCWLRTLETLQGACNLGESVEEAPESKFLPWIVEISAMHFHEVCRVSEALEGMDARVCGLVVRHAAARKLVQACEIGARRRVYALEIHLAACTYPSVISILVCPRSVLTAGKLAPPRSISVAKVCGSKLPQVKAQARRTPKPYFAPAPKLRSRSRND